MAKLQQKLLNVFGQSKTRLIIIDLITKNGNSVSYENLIEKVTEATGVQRQSVRKHLRKMAAEGGIKKDGGYITLRDPVEVIPSRSPLESWPIVGIALGLALLFISVLQGELWFKITATAFVLYAFAVNIRDIVNYLRKLHKS